MYALLALASHVDHIHSEEFEKLRIGGSSQAMKTICKRRTLQLNIKRALNSIETESLKQEVPHLFDEP